MTIPQNTHTSREPERFEERLLCRLLDNFDELTAPAVPPLALTPTRYRRRRLTWTVPAIGLAAALAVALVLISRGSPERPAGTHAVSAARGGAHTAGAVTPSHRVLYRLAAKTLSAPAVTQRYAILSEVDTETDQPGVQVKRTSVDDTQTGASVTYQTGDVNNPGAPPVLRDGPEADETAAYFDALPTNPTALRASLLAAGRQTLQADDAATAADLQKNDAASGITNTTPLPTPPAPSDDDLVYQTASDMLWSPVISSALRSALYKVLAGCADVQVNPNATDPSGAPAVEISRTDSYEGFFATFEDPSTGVVLAQQFSTGRVMNDAVYQPVTSSDTIPPDPYGS